MFSFFQIPKVLIKRASSSQPRFHAEAILCEILNYKISYKATHSERLSYKFENNLCSSIS